MEVNNLMKVEVQQAKFANDLVSKLASDNVINIDGPKVQVNVVAAPIILEQNPMQIDEQADRAAENLSNAAQGEQP